MQRFMDRLEAHYGKKPIVYTSVDFHRDNLVGHFQNYPFWVRSVAAHPQKIYDSRRWAFWQYTSTGVVPGRMAFSTANTSGVMTERMRINSAGAIFLTGVTTTASAANAFIDSGSSPANSILRSTSSLAYKRDVEPLDEGLAERFVRAARPIWYRSKATADNPAWSWYGLGAEDVAAIDPRMAQWGRQTEGGPLVPDGVAYDRLGVLLLPLVRSLLDRVAALEGAAAGGIRLQ